MKSGHLAALVAAAALAHVPALAQESPPPSPAPTPTPAPASAAGQSSTSFNPAISLIGNFLAFAGSNAVDERPSMSLEESELGLQAVVDPYARADFFISYTDEEVAVEEGYLTFTALPWDLLVKVGRFKLAMGKVNTLHPHVWAWPDSPLIMANLLGGEEGWNGDGISIAKLIPLGDTFSELTLQAVDGDGGPFAAPSRSDLAANAHFRVFRDLTDSTNIDVGASCGFGHNGLTDDTTTGVAGLDLTFRWKPLQQGNYRSLTVRGELLSSRREGEDGDTQDALGWYLSGEWQLARRWFVGGRIEAAEHADDASISDTGAAAILSFYPSEFSQLRGELRRRRYAGATTATELILQLQYAIGAHGAHPF